MSFISLGFAFLRKHSGQNLYNSEDWIGEDGKLTYSYDLSREGILFERRVRYI